MNVVVIWTILLVSVVCLVCFRRSFDKNQHGGSRAAIFSRFSYQPDFPMISQLTTVDFDRFSRVYNREGPLKLMAGRPYRFDSTRPNVSWLYPWHFPQELDPVCLQRAMTRCQEPVISLKSESDKLGGLAVETPKEIVELSPCFDQIYTNCQRQLGVPKRT
uniref:Uncharacterized protein n=1 Tax=viral metagenome TaxID=1070528 RepID=A0A6C0BL15_9ZZZZ